MLGLFRRTKESVARKRMVDVGWLVDAEKAGFIYDAPRPLQQAGGVADSPKGVNFCPSVIDHERRFFEVPCPVDLQLGLTRDKKGQLRLVDRTGQQATLERRKLQEMVHLAGPDRWRHPKRPVVQISAPYRFIADEPVWMMQLPPFNHFNARPWPGLVIGGRMPIDCWPRTLMWAFEWHDPSQDLILKRGEPWFYVSFQHTDPSRKVRLVQAEMTADLRQFCNGLDGVTNYVNRTFSLFDVARQRRPGTLLKACPPPGKCPVKHHRPEAMGVAA